MNGMRVCAPVVAALCGLCFASTQLEAAEIQVIDLEYISPAELVTSLDLVDSESGPTLVFADGPVGVRVNDASNQVRLEGESSGLRQAANLVAFYDVAPTQFLIEAQIVEVDQRLAREAGLDWQNVLDGSTAAISHSRLRSFEDGASRDSDRELNQAEARASVRVGDFIKLVEDTGSGRVTSVPSLVTTNNRTGSILDGSRVTYVSRYSSFTNLFETQEMTAGLSLSVKPSLGASGFLRLDVEAKLTTLGAVIGDTPSEHGQMLHNTVIARDGEPILLGGFKTSETERSRSGVPILGRFLPFLFSREVERTIDREILLVLTPRVVSIEDGVAPPAMD